MVWKVSYDPLVKEALPILQSHTAGEFQHLPLIKNILELVNFSEPSAKFRFPVREARLHLLYNSLDVRKAGAQMVWQIHPRL